MIGLSPLPTAHPLVFQHQWVRTSTPFYRGFILAMGRSPGFASAAGDSNALFRLAFATAPSLRDLTCAAHHNSLAHYAKGTPSPRTYFCLTRPSPTSLYKAKVGAGLRLVVGTRFQVLFHSPPGVLFTFPSRYWSTIGHGSIFSLTRWSGPIPTGFHVPRGTREH